MNRTEQSFLFGALQGQQPPFGPWTVRSGAFGNLTAIDRVGSDYYAFNATGSYFVSSDGGVTWADQTSSSWASAITSVQAAVSTEFSAPLSSPTQGIYAVGTASRYGIVPFYGITYTPLTWPGAFTDVRGLWSYDSSTVLAGGGSSIYVFDTTNIASPILTETVPGVVGAIQKGHRRYFVTSSGQIYQRTGANTYVKRFEAGVPLYDVFDGFGAGIYAVGANGTIVFGFFSWSGWDWQFRNSGTTENLFCVNQLVVGGANGTILIRADDVGSVWAKTPAVTTSAIREIYGTSFYSPYVAVGDSGLILTCP